MGLRAKSCNKIPLRQELCWILDVGEKGSGGGELGPWVVEAIAGWRWGWWAEVDSLQVDVTFKFFSLYLGFESENVRSRDRACVE